MSKMGKPRGTQELRTILAAWHYGCKEGRARSRLMVLSPIFLELLVFSCLQGALLLITTTPAPVTALPSMVPHSPAVPPVPGQFQTSSSMRGAEKGRDPGTTAPWPDLHLQFHVLSPPYWTPFAQAMVQGSSWLWAERWDLPAMSLMLRRSPVPSSLASSELCGSSSLLLSLFDLSPHFFLWLLCMEIPNPCFRPAYKPLSLFFPSRFGG